MRWLASAQTMRIDPPTPGLYVIIDYVARRMSVVRERDKSVVEMAAPDPMAGVSGARTAGAYIRRGDDTVAGVACTNWEATDRDSRHLMVCITTDGVMLRVLVDGAEIVVASSIRYAPQDPASFRVPADYAHQQLGPTQ